MELRINSQGMLLNREIHKLTPIFSKPSTRSGSPVDLFLIETKDNFLTFGSIIDQKFQEIASNPITDFTQVAFATTDTDKVTPGTVLVTVKAPTGLRFYEFNPNTKEFKTLGKDNTFSDEIKWDYVVGGQFMTGDNIVTLLTRDSYNGVKIYGLCQPINPTSYSNMCKLPLKTFPPEFASASKAWVKNPGTNPDLIFLSNDKTQKLTVFQLLSMTEMAKVTEINLPITNPVTNVEFSSFLPSGEKKDKDLIVSFESNNSIIFAYDGVKKEFKPRNMFHGNMTMSMPPGQGLQQSLFAIGDGPTIKAFDNYTLAPSAFEWNGPLLSQVSLITRPGKSAEDSSTWVFGNNITQPSEFHWFQTQQQKVQKGLYFKENLYKEAVSSSSEPPPISTNAILDLQADNPTTFSILEGIPSKMFADSADSEAAGVGFEIRLVPEIGLSFMYKSNAMAYDEEYVPVVGDGGWSCSNANYITIDRQSDVLFSEEKYFLLLDKTVFALKETVPNDDTWDVNKPRYFVVDNKDLTEDQLKNVKVSFENGVWTVDTRTSILKFGQTDESVKFGWKLQSWISSDTETMKKQPVEWHLTQSVDKGTMSPTRIPAPLTYEYKQIKGITENDDVSKRKEYTKTVLITSVKSSDGKTSVQIAYNSDNTGRMESYDAKVGGTKQSVRFSYVGNGNGKGKLAKIEQMFSNSWESMLEFGYEEQGLMSKVSIPQRKFQVNYEYKEKSFLHPTTNEVISRDFAPEDFTAAHEQGMSAFGNVNDLFVWNAANGDLTDLTKITNEVTRRKSASEIVLTLKINKNCVFQLVDSTKFTRTTLKVFCFDQLKTPKWKLSFVQTFTIKYIQPTLTEQGSFIGLAEDNLNLEILEWDFDKSDYIKKIPVILSSKPDHIQVSDTLIAWYTTESLSWIANRFNGWSTNPRQIKLDQFITCYKALDDNFDLGSDQEKDVKEMLDKLIFSLRQNIILFTSCRRDSESNPITVNNYLDLMIFDKNGDVKLDQRKLQIDRQPILDLPGMDQYDDQLKTMVHFRYRFDGSRNKWIVYLTTDKPDEIDEKELNKAFQESLAKETTRPVFFDLGTYLAFTASNYGIQVGNDTQIVHHGGSKGWQVEKLEDRYKPFDLKLGKQFRLTKESESAQEIKLFDEVHGHQLVYAFPVNNTDKIFSKFPSYVAATLDFPKETHVIYTNRVGGTDKYVTEKEVLVQRVFLPQWSTPQFLVTQSTLEGDKNIRVELAGFNHPKKMSSVLTSVHTTGPHTDQIKTYEYDGPQMTSTRDISWASTNITQGVDKRATGWVHHRYDEDTSDLAYDGDGNFVEAIIVEKNNATKIGSNNKTSLYDNSGQRVITDLFPFMRTECQVGFIGFEDYEVKKEELDGCTPWVFKEDGVIRSDVSSLTGTNFLRLNNQNDILSYEFKLKKDQSYLISTWVRSPTLKQYQNARSTQSTLISPLLSVTIEAAGIRWLSKILYTRGQWSFLQVKIYAAELNPLWKDIFYEQSPLTDDRPLTLKVEIKGQEDGHVDVDHVIVAPQTWNSEISMFNTNDDVIDTVLGSSGFIHHSLYDHLNNPIVKTNGLGEVTKFQVDIRDDINILDGLIQFESIEQPGWIQSFDDDHLITYSSGNHFQVFKHGIYHNHADLSTFGLNLNDPEALALSFSYNLFPFKGQSSTLTVSLNQRELKLSWNGVDDTIEISSPCGTIKDKTSPVGSLIFATHGNDRIMMWTRDKVLCDDATNIKKDLDIKFHIQGGVMISQMVVMPESSLRLTYFNALRDDEIQLLNLIDSNTVGVTHKMYDQAGRSEAVTKPTIVTVQPGQRLFGFRPNFVKEYSVQNQFVTGEVSDLNPDAGGIPFTSVIHQNHPLKEWKLEGQPGLAYSMKGNMGKSYSRKGDLITEILFPAKDGHTYQTTETPGGHSEIKIFDKDLLEVGTLTLNQGGKSFLTTNNYDEKHRLIVTLPPTYHEEKNTIRDNRPWKTIGYDPNTPWGIFQEFDDKDRIAKRSTVDSGSTEYVYDDFGNTKLSLHKSSKTAKEYHSVTYFDYENNGEGRLIEIGHVIDYPKTLTRAKLLAKTIQLNAENRRPIKRIEYLGQRYGPLTKSERVINFGGSQTDEEYYVQELDYGFPRGQIISDTKVTTTKDDEPALLTPTRFTWNSNADKVLRVHYASAPEESTLIYGYNILGQLSRISLARENFAPVTLAKYEYTAHGAVTKESLFVYDTGSKSLIKPIITSVETNSPGYPVKYTNDYFTQEISYTDNGYGDQSTGEPSLPSSMTFSNSGSWSPPEIVKKVTLEMLRDVGLSKQEASVCYASLKQGKYLDESDRILKLFVPGLEIESFPLICNTGDVSKKMSILFSKAMMSMKRFGYRFQYGNYKELIKAKFIDPFDTPGSGSKFSKQCSSPLTVQSLSEYLNVGVQDKGAKLWNSLRDKRFLVEDLEKGRNSIIHGKPGIQLWDIKLSNDLKQVNSDFWVYDNYVSQVLGTRVGKPLTLDTFSGIFENWQQTKNSTGTKDNAQKIYSMFQEKKYIESGSFNVLPEVFDKMFAKVVTDLGLELMSVFSGLQSYFACEVKSLPFDMEMYDMDSNGNHKTFYNGADRYQFKYKAGSNQITEADKNFGSEKFVYTHDVLGNLDSVKRTDKPVMSITYDPLTSRPTKIILHEKGQELRFRYDYKGERVSKRVYNSSTMELDHEVVYLGRDQLGRVLVEQELTYSSAKLPPKIRTTTYMYGPKGLFGFTRNGKFFNVLSDNIGSPRVILRNGEVVASYNYLPYGQIASKYLAGDPDGDIRYLFTGQELDDETGLYNFHFRMYDPFLGRFYQCDPDEQYFSPYKYAGNAPLFFIDPDGRFAFIPIIITIIAVALGAYLGGAAANGTWDPTKWKLNAKTFIGIITGIITGLFLPSGLLGSVSMLVGIGVQTGASYAIVIGLGVGVAYLNTAAAMGAWDPSKWDFTSPALWNAVFTGFGTAVSIPEKILDIRIMYKGLSALGKVSLISRYTIFSVGYGYYEAVSANDGEARFWKWDFTSPGTYMALLVKGPKMGMTLVTYRSTLKSLKSFLFDKKEIKELNKISWMTPWKNYYGKYDFVKATRSMDKGLGVTKFKSTAFGKIDQLDDWSRMVDGQVATSSSLVDSMPQSLRGFPDTLESIENIQGLKVAQSNPWFAQSAETAFKNLIQGSSTRLRRFEKENDKMAAIAFVINEDFLMIQGSSGFMFDSGAFLMEKNKNPNAFGKLAKNAGTFRSTRRSNLGVNMWDGDIRASLIKRLDLANTHFKTAYGTSLNAQLEDIQHQHANLTSFKDELFRQNVTQRIQETLMTSTTSGFTSYQGPVNSVKIINEAVVTTFVQKEIYPLRSELAQDFKLLEFLMKQNSTSGIEEIKARIAKNQLLDSELQAQMATYKDVVQLPKSFTQILETFTFTKDFDPLKQTWNPRSCLDAHGICPGNNGAFIHVDNIGFTESFKDYTDLDDVRRCSNCLGSTGSEGMHFILSQSGWVNPNASKELENVKKLSEGVDGYCYFNSSACYSRMMKEADVEKISRRLTRFERDLPQEETQMPSSSGASISSNSFIYKGVRVVRKIWSLFSNKVGRFDQETKQKPKSTSSSQNHRNVIEISKTQNNGGQTSDSKSPSQWEKCVPWALAEDGLSYTDGLTCFGPNGLVEVTPKIGATDYEDTAVLASRSGDDYANCQFMKKGSSGKAYCEGEKTNMKYTTFIDDRPFDRLNDQLLVVALLLHFYQSIVKQDELYKDSAEVQKTPVGESQLNLWRHELNSMKTGLEILAGKSTDPFYKKWAWTLLTDRMTELESFETLGNISDEELEHFQSNMEALKEDIFEGFVY